MLEENIELMITIPLSRVKIIKCCGLSNCSPTPTSSHSPNSHSLPYPHSPFNKLHTNSQSQTLNNLSPSLTLCGSDAEDIILVIDQAPKQSVHSIYSNSTELGINCLVETPRKSDDTCYSNNYSYIHSSRENVVARKFASPPGENYKRTIKRHIRYKDQRKFPATKQFLEFLCFSRETRHQYPKAKKFLFSNVPL